MEFILAYIIVMESGIQRMEYRYDHLFPSKQHCALYAQSQENIKYMQDSYKGRSIRMVYPSCASNPYKPEPIGMTG